MRTKALDGSRSPIEIRFPLPLTDEHGSSMLLLLFLGNVVALNEIGLEVVFPFTPVTERFPLLGK